MCVEDVSLISSNFRIKKATTYILQYDLFFLFKILIRLQGKTNIILPIICNFDRFFFSFISIFSNIKRKHMNNVILEILHKKLFKSRFWYNKNRVNIILINVRNVSYISITLKENNHHPRFWFEMSAKCLCKITTISN